MPVESLPVESWMMPDDVPGFAAQATDRIDAVLARLGEEERGAFWASVRKCYNTPYNDPKPRPLPTLRTLAPEPQAATPLQATAGSAGREEPSMSVRDVPMAAIPVAGFAVEAHAS
jgi:hypothetical protein